MSKPKKDEPDKLEDIFDVSMPDEDFDAMLRDLSDEDMLAYVQKIRHAFEQNPAAYPWITEDMLDDLACKAETFRKHSEIAAASESKAQLATENMNRSADRLLKLFNETDQSKGH